MRPSLSFLLASLLPFSAAFGGSATWRLNPIDSHWNRASSWTPATVPNGRSDIATFDVSNRTQVKFYDLIQLDAIVFTPGASSYNIASPTRDYARLILGGEGIVNNSTVEQRFDAWPYFGNTIEFRNSANAGNVHFTAHSGALIAFYDTASAGEATFDNTPAGIGGFNGGNTLFFGSSTAGNATINNYAKIGNGAATLFMDTSRAGTATVVSQGVGAQGNSGVQFAGHSSGDHATLIATAANYIDFLQNSRADSATVIGNGGTTSGASGAFISLVNRSTADNAILIAKSGSNGGNGAWIYFLNQTEGGNARVELGSAALLRIEAHDAPGVSLGSLNGAGGVLLGANNLTIGTNNLSTIFSGIIEDGTYGMGGSLTKVGTGTLELSGANTYTGETIIADGMLSVRNTTGSATGPGAVLVQAGSLSGDGIIAGSVTVGSGDPNVMATISPGASPLEPGIMTVQSNVALNSDATYQFDLQSDVGTACQMSASGVTIDANALFTVQDTGNSTLSPGTSFVVISNTSGNPISGTFVNLPDGGTITAGSNLFQANYEGGDGNDLTLTVVP